MTNWRSAITPSTRKMLACFELVEKLRAGLSPLRRAKCLLRAGLSPFTFHRLLMTDYWLLVTSLTSHKE